MEFFQVLMFDCIENFNEMNGKLLNQDFFSARHARRYTQNF